MDYKKLSNVNTAPEKKVTDSKKLSALEIARKKRLIDSKLRAKRAAKKIKDSEDEFYEISKGKDYITRKEWKDSGKKEKFEEVDYNKDGKICLEDWTKYCKTCDSVNKPSKKYAEFKVTDSYKKLAKRIKDDLEETETTEDAVNVAVDLLEEAPAEQVIAATIEVLGAAIDALSENVEFEEPTEDEITEIEETDEVVEEPAEEEITEEVTETE